MKLTKLFEAQKKLDDRIIKEKGLQGVDLLSKKILALQVELGELANELPEIFKFWSNKKNNYERALEELVDCWHLTLSIGNDIGFNLIDNEMQAVITGDISKLINELLIWTSCMRNYKDGGDVDFVLDYNYIYKTLIRLGVEMGFTWEQIEQAYYDKNSENHRRQKNGY